MTPTEDNAPSPAPDAPRHILFDTQLVIWSAEADARLPAAARAPILDANVAPVLGAAPIRAVVIRSALGHADFAADAVALAQGLREASCEKLPVTARHAAAVRALPCPGPEGHEDPFDPLLFAQARHEGVELATTDGRLAAYGESVLRVR